MCDNKIQEIKDVYREFRLFDCHPLFYNDDAEVGECANTLANVHEQRQINDLSISSLFQFGAIIPPLSPWVGVQRFRPGYRYCGVEELGPTKMALNSKKQQSYSQSPTQLVEKTLDSILQSVLRGRKAILLFSGGVDSGIIASRLAHLGYKDTILVNFAFSKCDEQSEIAEKMAGDLGLRFVRIFNEEPLTLSLQNPGKEYAMPFGDHSTVPTSALARAVIAEYDSKDRVILDGTGADGLFGMAGKIRAWRNVYKIPYAFRALPSFWYKNSGWVSTSRVEALGKVSRRSVLLPVLAAMLAQNPLSGICYRQDYNKRTSGLLADWIEGLTESDLVQTAIVADLALTCANTFAQKACKIYKDAGFIIHYPFLDLNLVELVLANLRYFDLKEPKALLKQSLSSHVSKGLVYRPKSGFVDPHSNVFYLSDFQDMLRASIDEDGPLRHLLNLTQVKKILDILSKKQPLPPQTFNFVWSLVFSDRWYRTSHS